MGVRIAGFSPRTKVGWSHLSGRLRRRLLAIARTAARVPVAHSPYKRMEGPAGLAGFDSPASAPSGFGRSQDNRARRVLACRSRLRTRRPASDGIGLLACWQFVVGSRHASTTIPPAFSLTSHDHRSRSLGFRRACAGQMAPRAKHACVSPARHLKGRLPWGAPVLSGLLRRGIFRAWPDVFSSACAICSGPRRWWVSAVLCSSSSPLPCRTGGSGVTETRSKRSKKNCVDFAPSNRSFRLAPKGAACFCDDES